MLALSRKLDETVVVTVGGVRVSVKVLRLAQGRVMLGFDVPRGEATIHRGEVQAEIDREVET